MTRLVYFLVTLFPSHAIQSNICYKEYNKNALSLEEFLFRSRAISIYRELCREIYKTHERQDLMRFLRDEFKVNSKQSDLQYRKYLLSQALNTINQMTASLGITIQKNL